MTRMLSTLHDTKLSKHFLQTTKRYYQLCTRTRRLLRLVLHKWTLVQLLSGGYNFLLPTVFLIFLSSAVGPIRDLKIRRRLRKRERRKNNRFNCQNNNFARALFCTFLCRHCKTTTWKCLIPRCTEEVHERRRNFLSLSELGCGS